MNIGKSITFIFDDHKWLEKLLIGGLIFLLTILFSWTIIGAIIGWAILLGYMVALMRNVHDREEYPLPAWSDLGGKLSDGIKLMIAHFIWALPLFLIWLPMIFFAIIGGVLGGEDTFGAILAMLGVCTTCIAVIYGIMFLLVMPGISIRYASEDNIGATIDFETVFGFTRKYIGEIIIVLIIVWVVQLVANFIGSLLCGVGILFTGYWALAVQGHLYGQLWLKEDDKTQDLPDEGDTTQPALPEESASSDTNGDDDQPQLDVIAAETDDKAKSEDSSS